VSETKVAASETEEAASKTKEGVSETQEGESETKGDATKTKEDAPTPMKTTGAASNRIIAHSTKTEDPMVSNPGMAAHPLAVTYSEPWAHPGTSAYPLGTAYPSANPSTGPTQSMLAVSEGEIMKSMKVF
jgi:hypothetical protein